MSSRYMYKVQEYILVFHEKREKFPDVGKEGVIIRKLERSMGPENMIRKSRGVRLINGCL
jgi:hypothetical protein